MRAFSDVEFPYDFVWPKLAYFNWAIDYFDFMVVQDGCCAEQCEIAIDLVQRPLGLITCYADDVQRTAEAIADDRWTLLIGVAVRIITVQEQLLPICKV